jgi:hypothetical protein
VTFCKLSSRPVHRLVDNLCRNAVSAVDNLWNRLWTSLDWYAGTATTCENVIHLLCVHEKLVNPAHTQ